MPFPLAIGEKVTKYILRHVLYIVPLRLLHASLWERWGVFTKGSSLSQTLSMNLDLDLVSWLSFCNKLDLTLQTWSLAHFAKTWGLCGSTSLLAQSILDSTVATWSRWVLYGFAPLLPSMTPTFPFLKWCRQGEIGITGKCPCSYSRRSWATVFQCALFAETTVMVGGVLSPCIGQFFF